MCSCKGFAQCILVLLNFIFLQIGLVMFSFGIIAQIKPEYIFNLLGRLPGMSQVPEVLNLGGILMETTFFMIIIGVVVAVIAFFGCCGACCESRDLLIAYIVALVIVLMAEVALIIFASVAPEKVKENLQKSMNESRSRFKEDITLLNDGTFKLPNDSVSLGWTSLQIGSSCCGTYNYTDYSNNYWPRNVTIKGVTHYAAVPISCCSKNKALDLEISRNYDNSTFTNLIGCLNGNHTYINQKGCFESIFDLFLRSQTIAIGIAAGIIAVELLLIMLAAVTCHRRNRRIHQDNKLFYEEFER